MGKTKILKILLIIYLFLFPLGQFTRIELSIFGTTFPVYPSDLVVFLISILGALKYKLFKLKIPHEIGNLFFVFLFSFIISIFLFDFDKLFIAAFYFVRLFTYLSLILIIPRLFSSGNSFKKIVFNLLTLASIITAIIGWGQYIFIPDTRFLKEFGWDDHLYRMISSFLDPAFTGIIFVFGFLILLGKLLETKRTIRKALLLIFLIVSIAFTYSRASYFSGIGGIVALFGLGKIKKILFIIFLMVVLLFSLPRPSSEGVYLERTASIIERVKSYREGIEIIKKSPVFGVGYNNYCQSRKILNQKPNYDSHSCSGNDNWLIFLLSTTGVVGLFCFLDFLKYLIVNTSVKNRRVVISMIIALLIHGSFTNSIFYPWVLGYLLIFISLNFKPLRGVN